MKQNVSVTEKVSSARICRSNQACASGLRLCAQLSRVLQVGYTQVAHPADRIVEPTIVQPVPVDAIGAAVEQLGGTPAAELLDFLGLECRYADFGNPDRFVGRALYAAAAPPCMPLA